MLVDRFEQQSSGEWLATDPTLEFPRDIDTIGYARIFTGQGYQYYLMSPNNTFDEDGQIHIFIVDESGPLTSSPEIIIPSSHEQAGMMWYDINHDELDDLILFPDQAPTLEYLNHGDGTFEQLK